jgi:hypothetical protein
MHEFVFVVVTFGGNELNHVTGLGGPDYYFMLILVLVLSFFSFSEAKIWTNRRQVSAPIFVHPENGSPH